VAKTTSSKTVVGAAICQDTKWSIRKGELKRAAGRPAAVKRLFKVVAEKIPFEFLSRVKNSMEQQNMNPQGVYIAHDSMGYPRYIGRGNIFQRLQARKDAQILELQYFSFYVVENKKHEREIETIMIRAAGPLLDFNLRKVRNDIQPGDVKDFEAGTHFYERQYKKGPKSRIKDRSADA
jgi:hypothetical protein